MKILLSIFVAAIFLTVAVASAEFISPAPRYIEVELVEYEAMGDRIVYLERIQRLYKRLKKTCRGAR